MVKYLQKHHADGATRQLERAGESLAMQAAPRTALYGAVLLLIHAACVRVQTTGQQFGKKCQNCRISRLYLEPL